jgi:hypothetical protein
MMSIFQTDNTLHENSRKEEERNISVDNVDCSRGADRYFYFLKF